MLRKDLLEVAFDANREDADVLSVGGGLLNKASVDNLLVLAQRAAAVVAHLERAN